MSLHTLILAAGASRRFGARPKQLAKINGQTMLERAVQLAHSVSDTSVVLGCEYQQLVPVVQTAKVIIHSEWQEGIGSSISCGVASLPNHVTAVMVMLCDQVAITQEDLGELVKCYNNSKRDESDGKIVCASYAGRLGVPAIFPRRFFSQLVSLQGDLGAKKIIEANEVLAMPLARAAVDIDTQENLNHFMRGLCTNTALDISGL